MLLGSGTYGNVVVSKKSSKHAVKTFKKTDFKFFVRELWNLSLVKDVPHFCQLVSYDIDLCNFTMQRYETNLHDLSGVLSYDRRYSLTDDIVEQIDAAVSFLHSRKIAHNDISLSNIFCNYQKSTNKIECFLGDFSLSSINDDFKSHTEGEFLYCDRDPSATNMESDVWSFGVSIFDFLTKLNKWSDVEVSQKSQHLDFLKMFPQNKIKSYTYKSMCSFLKLKGKDRPHVEVAENIEAKFDKMEKKTKNQKTKKAISYLKRAGIDQYSEDLDDEGFADHSDRNTFTEHFEPIDIIDFIKVNFS